MKFVPPNFQARIREEGQEAWTLRLVYGESVEEARRILEERDLEIEYNSIVPYDFERGWRRDATDETAVAIQRIEAGEEYEWVTTLWGRLKEHLQDMFQGKCAYCDAPFTTVSFGDVEHYRPKGAVTDAKGTKIYVTDDAGDEVPHPGYYWLAYDPENYLPACEKCNRSGKKAKFPIDGTRAYAPDHKLDREVPHLLNPYHDDFETHLSFYPSDDDKTPGFAKGLDERGRVSVRVYKLNRKDLPRARRKQQGNAVQEFKIAFNSYFNSEDNSMINNLRNRYDALEPPFVLARKVEIEAFTKKMGVRSPFSE